MHARSKKHVSSYDMHLFFPYLLNDSQMISLMIPFSKPNANLSNFHYIMHVMPDKAVFVSVLCCFVYSVTGETAVFTAPKAAPGGKEWICILIQTNAKKNQVCRQYANVSCWC